MICMQMGDSIRPIIEEKMSAINSADYNSNDFSIYFSLPHINVVWIDNERIIAFGCMVVIGGKNCMCYSWCENSFFGKRTYLKGLRYLISKYNIVLDDGTLPEYIRKRI